MLFANVCGRLRGDYSQKNQICDLVIEVLPGVLGNRGIRPSISGDQGNKSLKLKGTGEQRQFWPAGNIEKSRF